jgi:curved DNA-binding protein CbpA
MMGAVPAQQAQSIEAIHRGRIIDIERHDGSAAKCVLSQGAPVLVPGVLAPHLSAGDEIEVALGSGFVEIHVHKAFAPRALRELYYMSIGYVTQPKEDKRKELFVVAETRGSHLGIRTVHFPCDTLRDYFYVAHRHREWTGEAALYEVLGITSNAGPAELRLSFRIRQIEAQKQAANKNAVATLERAYNILAQPKLRACYDALLKDSEAPVLFPYGGFGSLLVDGDRSRDGQTFFVTRILAFRPETRQRHFRASLRRFEFYADRAIYRDARRKLELVVDQATMPLVWDESWNRWKHLLAAKVEIDATFVQAGKYRIKRGEWALVQCDSALPSRLNVKLPSNVQGEVDRARETYHRFGQYSEAFDQIKARIEHEPVEKRELDRILGQLGVPRDFDVSQLSWRPDYDPFFFRQLAKLAQRLYLYRTEYIFDTVAGAVVETPQLGHATYLFAKPASMETFLALYVRTNKEDIRANRNNVAERLGFLCRIVHGVDPRGWVKELRAKLGEPPMMAKAVET